MFADWFSVVVLVAGLGSGLMAGVFFAFSSFVMTALRALPPPGGIAAMQAINRSAITPAFMTLFLGTAVACLAVLAGALVRWQQPGATSAVLGSLAYLIGGFVVTVAANVPRNDALARVDPSSPQGSDAWARYLPSWTWWNHLRTIAALGAAALLVLALLQMRGGTS